MAMTCPRCAVGEIVPQTRECSLCGFSIAGGVAVQPPVADEVEETIAGELAPRFDLRTLVRREPHRRLYLARDLEEERDVALRVIPLVGPVTVDLLQQFDLAATAGRLLHHPHLITPTTSGYTTTTLWYAAAPARGTVLAARLDAHGPMSLQACLDLVEQAVSGLDFLHRSGAIHGDLTPESVEVDDAGWVRVGDMGVAYRIVRSANVDPAWRTLLRSRYHAPELLAPRAAGTAADQYSLAAVTLACLAGTDGSDDRVSPSVHAVRERRRDIPDHVLGALDRALRPDPVARFGSVLDFLAVLHTGQARASGAAVPTPVGGPTRHQLLVSDRPQPVPDERRSTRRIVVAMIATIVIAATLLLLPRGHEPPAAGANAELVEMVDPPPRTPDASRADTRTRAVEPRARPPAAPARDRPAPSPPAVALAPGRLFVNARPWGVVFLNGREIGNTPRANVSIPAGRHVLRVVREGYEPFEEVILVRPGEDVRLTEIVLRPLQP